jgi:hypothetical protein
MPQSRHGAVESKSNVVRSVATAASIAERVKPRVVAMHLVQIGPAPISSTTWRAKPPAALFSGIAALELPRREAADVDADCIVRATNIPAARVEEF